MPGAAARELVDELEIFLGVDREPRPVDAVMGSTPELDDP
jgi:hypothetical protein